MVVIMSRITTKQYLIKLQKRYSIVLNLVEKYNEEAYMLEKGMIHMRSKLIKEMNVEEETNERNTNASRRALWLQR